ncbi:cache domain-containing protein [Pseudoduganella namucuonensis]|uniref:Single Cache domain 2-containing protein n=1 Tax=Pseudoduganella namucuonensis TaxID=1035707 RepID=A0A1I7IKI8_9BURK|nr:cache domain-containing protein [Pseudoduganella namucuonensis]SFU73457.1 Single Cache domain 2-containing protein [Pseudoduganella namucuonensis]
MKHAITAALLLAFAGGALSADYATPQQAEQLVAKAVAAVRKDAAKTYEEITAKDAAWVHGDLYPVVYDLDGKVLAHGQNPKMVGKDLIELRDADGRPFVRERVDLARQKGKFWQNYSFLDPVTKQILAKRMYCERLDERVVCAGVYVR